MVLASICVAAITTPARAHHGVGQTAVERHVVGELHEFTSWLQENRAKGFIGEVGWPGGEAAEDDDWNHVAARWLDEADAAGLWVTAWATGEWWPSDYRLAIYTASSNTTVDTVGPQAAVLEPHLGRRGRGINVAGAEFAAPSNQDTSSFSNENPGEYGVAYHYDSRRTFRFLAQRGVRLVRLPFRWERLQPRLGQPLSMVEVSRLSETVAAAGRAGLKVVLDVHNYGAYYLERDGIGIRCPIGSRRCTTTDFVGLWRRLSRTFDASETVVGYGLMNEPVGIPAGDAGTAAQRWERISQRVLSTIRARGDETTIMVPGYDYSGVQDWRNTHPDGWIVDPAKRFRYEAHHYFDHDHSGTYRLSYQEETARATE